ncbi:hypothetical protein CTAYLR_006346 [Chrysophaeum taylorii]|uniref:ABC transporter domain-containing protein n=1 Tax=Chrysophaeum taylorii TaxID=2483200 RepID=A0AAD7U8V3_9STRA|nr:hypothetical protein CTAYLR_006346 [Chrysophaeum taylorii]
MEAFAQLRVLLWKHWITRKRSISQNVQLFVLPIISLSLCFLFYLSFNTPDRDSTGWLELIFVPLAMVQLTNVEVVTLVSEKYARLLETMRIMSLRVETYYAAHAVEASVLGIIIALVSATVAYVEGLFNRGAWGSIFVLLWVFTMAVTAFAFALAACFDTPQTAGQVALAAQVAQVVIFFAIIGDDPDAATSSENWEERGLSVFPLVGLELGVNSFRGPPTQSHRSYKGIPLGQIIAILGASGVAFVILAGYLTQVMPSAFGASKPWYFCLAPLLPASIVSPGVTDDDDEEAAAAAVVREEEDPGREASVVISRLRKRFGENVAVKRLDVKLYENEIFALLGHNGAGKSTAINTLTGVLESDSSAPDGGATIYGHSIRGEMDAVRRSIGVCHQHDVLFDLLTCREHLVLFARIKGVSLDETNAEADDLLARFNLTDRAGHLAHELSGGMRRKLSCALALCGSSKFVLLDEPTAGLDTLARRELWDLLLTAKRGRTMLVCTHYMSEADVLGDKIGIMAQGVFKCVGSSSFLKRSYGGGYKVTCDYDKLDDVARRHFGDEATVEGTTVSLPQDRVADFPAFFSALDRAAGSYGLTLTSMEDVFLAVGGDETAQPSTEKKLRIGSGRQYEADPKLQAYALAYKRFQSAQNDPKTLGLLLLPIAAVVTAFLLQFLGVFGNNEQTDDLLIATICAGGFFFYPAFVAEQVVSERESQLLSVLRVMGCDGTAYWVGTFVGDYWLFSIVVAVYWLTLVAIAPTRWVATTGGSFYVPPVFGVMIVTYSYALSHAFDKAKRCIAVVPGVQFFQFLAPQLVILIFYQIIKTFNSNFSFDRIQGGQIWLLVFLCPQGAFMLAFYNTANNLWVSAAYAPRFYLVMVILAAQATCFILLTRVVEERALRPLERLLPRDPPEDDDPDVRREARLVADMSDDELRRRSTNKKKNGDDDDDDDDDHDDLEKAADPSAYALIVKRVRKVYGEDTARPTVAVGDLSFRVAQGECFGLLGANGAGKSTTISMIIRAVEPTQGDIFVNGHSVLDEFKTASQALGVVAQGNTLWDNLSCENHLELFARIRGVPAETSGELVDAALDQLELRPHALKLASRLSGGMKRKLCTAIAIIGDPQCVLLDEPSAGLDPVSRRNLWNLLRETMSTRAVVLTSHLMDEVEALCDRIMILVKAKARCLGTIQHLIQTRGKHFEVSLTAADVEDAKRVVVETLPLAVLDDEHGGFLQYNVPYENMSVGKAFGAFEKADAIQDYSIAQPSLESVFIRCVKEHSAAGTSLTMVADALADKEEARDEEKQEEEEQEEAKLEDVATYTGCTRRTHRRMAVVSALLLVVLVIAGGAVGPVFLVVIVPVLVALVWGIVGCLFAKEQVEGGGGGGGGEEEGESASLAATLPSYGATASS